MHIIMSSFSVKSNIRHLINESCAIVGVRSCQSHWRFETNSAENETLKEDHCKTLGLTNNFTNIDLRNAFLKMAKIYHPDSGSKDADAVQFARIETAYQFLKNLNQGHETELDDVYPTLEKDFGIKHTVPQHRQFLTYGGIGYGSPSERQRQYQLSRVDQATQNVFQHKVNSMNKSEEKDIIFRDAALARQYKTRQGMDRLVEDLIQASMARGEFENLAGSGKPFKNLHENPYVDTTTHKLNQILISNGFTPEWIVLQKEIKDERLFFRNALRERRAHLGKPPIPENLILNWIHSLSDMKEDISRLNTRIDKFNNIVPVLNKQQVHFDLKSEAKKVVAEDPLDLKRNGMKTENDTLVLKSPKSNILIQLLNYIRSNAM